MLPTERRRAHSGGSLRIVSGLAENTNSIFCDSSPELEAANGCLVLREQEPMPRGIRCASNILELLNCTLSRACPGTPVPPLDR
jgi:hypothetical protein